MVGWMAVNVRGVTTMIENFMAVPPLLEIIREPRTDDPNATPDEATPWRLW